MRVELTGFSQGISLASKEETVNYLDFRREDGRMFRVPISDEALEGLMQEIYGGEAATPEKRGSAPEVALPPEPDADVFGGEQEEPAFDGEELPESEDDIPPL